MRGKGQKREIDVTIITLDGVLGMIFGQALLIVFLLGIFRMAKIKHSYAW